MKDSTVIRMFCFSPIGICGWSSAGRFKVGKTNKFLALLLDTFLIILAKSSWKAASIARMDLNISDSLSFDSILMRTTISLTPNLKDYNFIKKYFTIVIFMIHNWYNWNQFWCKKIPNTVEILYQNFFYHHLFVARMHVQIFLKEKKIFS